MNKDENRYKEFPVNKYQKKILMITVIPGLLMCTIVTILLIIFFKELIGVIASDAPALGIQFVNQWAMFIVIIVLLLFGSILFWAYKVSNNIVGPFGRVIREMDEMIAGQRKGHIMARKHDELANEVLKRFNILLDQLNKTKGDSS